MSEAKVQTFHMDEPRVEGVLVGKVAALWKVQLSSGQVVMRRAENLTPLNDAAKEMLKCS